MKQKSWDASGEIGRGKVLRYEVIDLEPRGKYSSSGMGNAPDLGAQEVGRPVPIYEPRP